MYKISNTEIENVEVIAELPNVKYLVLDENKINDISSFINNKEYFSFNMSGNPLMVKGPETVQIGIYGCAGTWTYDVFVKKENVVDIAEKNHEKIIFRDQNLKKTLINYGVDINGDAEISIYEANRWKGMLYLEDKEIKSTDGLEHFESINYLSLKDNQISSIGKLSDLNNLKHLDLGENLIREFEYGAGFDSLESLKCICK